MSILWKKSFPKTCTPSNNIRNVILENSAIALISMGKASISYAAYEFAIQFHESHF